MQLQDKGSTRVIGSMLLTHQYDHTDIVIMGYPQDMNPNSKQFTLKTTDGKNIVTIMSRPMDECVDGLVQIRGQYDGQKIQAQGYTHLIPEISSDFDCDTYNEAIKLLNPA